MERLNKTDFYVVIRDDKVLLSRYIVVKTNNNCEKRGGERVSFSSPQFSIQRKISKKDVFVPWGIS